MRYEFTDDEWTAIKPMLPNKPRGVPRVNDRRVLNGIIWVLRSGAPWREAHRIVAAQNLRAAIMQSSYQRTGSAHFLLCLALYSTEHGLLRPLPSSVMHASLARQFGYSFLYDAEQGRLRP
jgi:hypothetical protein